jgi:hypothetical protein
MDFLISLLLACLVFGLIYWIISSLIPIPQPIKNIVLAIFGIIAIVWLLQTTGIFGGHSWGFNIGHNIGAHGS